MTIRTIRESDVEDLFRMMCLLDEETEYMLYEPGERQSVTPNLGRLHAIAEEAASGTILFLVAENENNEIVGFLSAMRGRLNRTRHTAQIVVGIRKAYRRQGIGTEFFRRLDAWASENGVVRLELTVECENKAAIRLYEKSGFLKEGVHAKSMKVNGAYVDEYCMAKILMK